MYQNIAQQVCHILGGDSWTREVNFAKTFDCVNEERAPTLITRQRG